MRGIPVCGEKMTVDGRHIAFSMKSGYNAVKRSKQGCPRFTHASPLLKAACRSAMRSFLLRSAAFRAALCRVSFAPVPFVPKNRPFMAKGLKCSHLAAIMKADIVRLSQIGSRGRLAWSGSGCRARSPAYRGRGRDYMIERKK